MKYFPLQKKQLQLPKPEQKSLQTTSQKMREICAKFALMTLAKYKNHQSNEIYSKLTIKTPKQHP